MQKTGMCSVYKWDICGNWAAVLQWAQVGITNLYKTDVYRLHCRTELIFAVSNFCAVQNQWGLVPFSFVHLQESQRQMATFASIFIFADLIDAVLDLRCSEFFPKHELFFHLLWIVSHPSRIWTRKGDFFFPLSIIFWILLDASIYFLIVPYRTNE